MPIPIAGEPIASSLLSSRDYGYKYPYGLNLKPSSELHRKIISEVMLRATESYSVMSTRYSDWAKIDETSTAYIQADADEKKLQLKDPRKPVSIVVPQSYATLEIMLSYLIAALLESPILRYEGNGPEDIYGAILLEKVIDWQCDATKAFLPMYLLLQDGLKYGLSALSPTWVRKTHTVARKRPSLFAFGQDTRVHVEEVYYEGNELVTIDPYLYFPDVNMSAHEAGKGEYLGWIQPTNIMSLLMQERTDPDIFNVLYLKEKGSAKSKYYNPDASGRNSRSKVQTGTAYGTGSTSRCDILWMNIDLIPSEWKLPGGSGNRRGDYPETWLFGVGGDCIVTYCKRVSLNHGMKPVVTFAPDFDGRTATPISRMEVISGLQTALDWLFNCYDDKTEVLTSRGWVNLANTLPDDEVATVDPDTKLMWFEKPKQWFVHDYEGLMANFVSSRMDICVTPNHSMYVRKRYNGSWEFKPAALVALDSKREYKTLGNIRWKGQTPDPVVFSELLPKRDRGCDLRYPEAVLDPMVLAGFLGWFLSEGSISNGEASGSYSVSLKQAKHTHIEDLDGIMESMPFHVTKTFDVNKRATQWTITDKRLYMWLKEHCYTEGGTTGEFKKVPDFVRTWDEFYLGLLFERAMWGDGYWMPGHENLGQYGSKSLTLINGMQEIALRLGFFSHWREEKTTNGLPFYTLNISTAETSPAIATRNCFKSEYCGKVYCFENSTHLTVTRRNGKIAVQGQSHIANVRKALNDMLVVDPSLINMNDLADPKPGKLIRMKRAVWGRGVKDAVMQLNITDITKNNIQDAAVIGDLIKNLGGSVDAISGIRRKTAERVTAEEVRGDRSSGISRLEKLARIASWQAFHDLAYQMASNTQQLMSQDTYIKVTGTWADVLVKEYGAQPDGRLLVSPFDIMIPYDIRCKDGSIPGGNFSEAWTQMLPTILQDTEVRQGIDVLRLVKYIIRSMGVKNINQFDRRMLQQAAPMNAQIMPDEQVESQAQAGNLVPLEAVA
jgi:hypothetical protein